jgi:hypothetical protein
MIDEQAILNRHETLRSGLDERERPQHEALSPNNLT